MTRGRTVVCMTVATLHRIPSFRGLASSPRRGLVEVATLAGLYAIYEVVRGQAHATLPVARGHTDEVVALERHVHLFGERAVQRAAHVVPALPATLGVAYIALHFIGTTTFLVWLHREHRERFPLVRKHVILEYGFGPCPFFIVAIVPRMLFG